MRQTDTWGVSQSKYEECMAHPTRFERVTFAFGVFKVVLREKTPGHPMLRYPTLIINQSGMTLRRLYPAIRLGFPPSAYVVLTREPGFGGEKIRA
jgi:hypothetical protein